MTWKELKDFCNSIPDGKLDNKVILWREDEAVTNIEAEKLEEDHYVSVDSEGCFPVSEAKNMDKGIKIKKVYDTGDPILWEKF